MNFFGRIALCAVYSLAFLVMGCNGGEDKSGPRSKLDFAREFAEAMSETGNPVNKDAGSGGSRSVDYSYNLDGISFTTSYLDCTGSGGSITEYDTDNDGDLDIRTTFTFTDYSMYGSIAGNLVINLRSVYSGAPGKVDPLYHHPVLFEFSTAGTITVAGGEYAGTYIFNSVFTEDLTTHETTFSGTVTIDGEVFNL